jgi:hypothetical protein
MRFKEQVRTRGRAPRSTTIFSFYDASRGSRDPGDWPTLLRRSWEETYGQRPQPYPFGPDNMQNRGARASQYTS